MDLILFAFHTGLTKRNSTEDPLNRILTSYPHSNQAKIFAAAASAAYLASASLAQAFSPADSRPPLDTTATHVTQTTPTPSVSVSEIASSLVRNNNNISKAAKVQCSSIHQNFPHSIGTGNSTGGTFQCGSNFNGYSVAAVECEPHFYIAIAFRNDSRQSGFTFLLESDITHTYTQRDYWECKDFGEQHYSVIKQQTVSIIRAIYRMFLLLHGHAKLHFKVNPSVASHTISMATIIDVQKVTSSLDACFAWYAISCRSLSTLAYISSPIYLLEHATDARNIIRSLFCPQVQSAEAESRIPELKNNSRRWSWSTQNSTIPEFKKDTKRWTCDPNLCIVVLFDRQFVLHHSLSAPEFIQPLVRYVQTLPRNNPWILFGKTSHPLMKDGGLASAILLSDVVSPPGTSASASTSASVSASASDHHLLYFFEADSISIIVVKPFSILSPITNQHLENIDQSNSEVQASIDQYYTGNNLLLRTDKFSDQYPDIAPGGFRVIHEKLDPHHNLAYCQKNMRKTLALVAQVYEKHHENVRFRHGNSDNITVKVAEPYVGQALVNLQGWQEMNSPSNTRPHPSYPSCAIAQKFLWGQKNKLELVDLLAKDLPSKKTDGLVSDHDDTDSNHSFCYVNTEVSLYANKTKWTTFYDNRKY